MDVVAYDYTGYGISPYKPSEKNLYSDIECVLSFIVNFMDFPLNKVILCGFSLGSGPTIELATRYQSLPFIVLFAPLASCLSIVEGEKGPEKVSSHDMFTNLEKMSKLSCDVVFIHGEKDRMIPSHHSSRMFARYIETHKDLKNTAWLLEVEGADHHQLIQELLDPTTEYRRSFMQYFEFLLGSNHTTKKKESFEILKLITEDDKSPQKGEDNISKKSDEIEKEKIHSENHENEEDRKRQGKMEVIEEEKENKMIFQTEEPTKKALSPKDELLKLETSKLRLLFSKLVVNKPPSKNKNNKQKPNHNDMYKEAKALI